MLSSERQVSACDGNLIWTLFAIDFRIQQLGRTKILIFTLRDLIGTHVPILKNFFMDIAYRFIWSFPHPLCDDKIKRSLLIDSITKIYGLEGGWVTRECEKSKSMIYFEPFFVDFLSGLMDLRRKDAFILPWLVSCVKSFARELLEAKHVIKILSQALLRKTFGAAQVAE